jgi:hypothetical protein
MCRALYDSMHVLCFADQKNPAMDKLYYYVLQTDCMLPKFLGEVEKSTNFLTPNMIAAMGRVQSAGVSDLESEDDAADDNNDEQSYSLGEKNDEVDSDNEAIGDIVERQVVLHLDVHLLKRILLTADIAVLQSLDRTYSHGSGYAVLDKAAGKVEPRLLPYWIYFIT